MWWMKTHGQSKHDKADKNRAWKKGGRKMVQVAHRQITLLPIPSSASLSFFSPPPEERRSTSILPVVRPTVFLVFENDQAATVRSTWGRGRGGGVTCIPWQRSLGNPKSGRIASHQGVVEHAFRAILVNSLFLQGWKKRWIFLLEIFTSLRPPPKGR